jgi:hypothetical protein
VRKSISLFLCFSLLSCLSLNLFSQSAENELDQVKLAQQFVGTWETSTGEDSIQQITIIPFGAGGHHAKVVFKSDGKVYAEGVSVIGFSPDRKTLGITVVWPNGLMIHDMGGFVTEKKLVVERFMHGSPTHAVAKFEYEFTSPTSYSAVIFRRGQNNTWEPQWENKATFTKID